jgi:hypothetical protein
MSEREIKPMSVEAKKGKRAYDENGNVRPADERFLSESEKKPAKKPGKQDSRAGADQSRRQRGTTKGIQHARTKHA